MEASNISPESDVEEKVLLDTLMSRMSALEQTLNKAVVTVLPKVDALLTQRNLEVTSKEASASNIAPSTLLLELAGRGDHVSILELVEDLDFDFQNNPQRNERGDTALHVAARGGHLRAVVVLVGLGWDINCPGNRLRTPLHCAVAQGHLKVAQRLLIAGAKVDAKDVDNATPLALAAGQGNREGVEMFLQRGTRPSEIEFFMAAESFHWKIVELLLQKGGRFDSFWSNKQKDPLIVLACKAEKWDLMKRLLEKGASATNCKTDRESALVWATIADHAGVVQELLRHGAASHFLQMRWAITFSRSTAVVWTFVKQVPEMIRGELGEVGILTAGSHGRVDVLQAFLEAGVDVNTKDRADFSVLSRAICHRNIACVKLLLKNGADVNIINAAGDTPLHFASSKGHVDCLRILLEAGARTSERNGLGKTPLEVAKSSEVHRILGGK